MIFFLFSFLITSHPELKLILSVRFNCFVHMFYSLHFLSRFAAFISGRNT